MLERYIRYSLQLLLLVSIFLIGESRKKYFLVRLISSLAVYFGVVAVLSYVWTWIGDAAGAPVPFVFSSIVNFTVMFGMMLGGIYVCFDIKLIDVIFDGTGGYALQHAIFCFITIITYFTGTFDTDTFGGLVLDYALLRIIPYVAVALFFYFYVIKPKRRSGELEYKNGRMIFFSAVIFLGAVILNEFAFFIPGSGNQLSNTFTSAVVCKGYSILCCVVSLAMQFSISKNEKTEHDKYLQERIFEIQRSQYSISKETVELFNIKFHDMKHMIDVLGSGDANGKEEVIKSLKEEISGAGMIFDTGNKVLDTVLMQKSLVCQSNGIHFTCLADGQLTKIIDDMDLYVLVANILDNAINAVKPLEESKRGIELTIGESGGALLVRCENYCGKNTNFVNGLPVTDGDKRYHGFGTRSILHTAEKYKGAARMYQDGDVFHTDIVFPLG